MGLCLYDIDPQAPTHFLVIPKEHIPSVNEIDAQNSQVVAKVYEAIASIARQLGLTSYRVVSNCGEDAGQTVFHLHFHVLGGRSLPGLRAEQKGTEPSVPFFVGVRGV